LHARGRLPDPMHTVLGLQQRSWGPIQFEEDNVRGRRERQGGATGRDGDQGHAALGALLEAKHGRMARCGRRRAINPNVCHTSQRALLHSIKHRQVMTK
jgi:hypothetical protein